MKNTIDKSIQRDVAALLGWDEQQYGQFIFDCGVAYLNELAPLYPQVVAQITRSEIFWNWWKAHWELRDKEYLETVDDLSEQIIDAVELYKNLHDPRTLSAAIYLNGQVLQESYVSLIAEITNQQREVAA